MQTRMYGILLCAAWLLASHIPTVVSQTWSNCNPLTQGSCPADPALGKSVNIDFSQQSDSFTSSGAPTYGSNGAAFTIRNSGDSPTITSRWYIMFGHVDFVVKAAPGTGIVSSAILQSDCLDEIDFEWLGGDDTQVQSNYFGKGQTVTGYNRGAFHGAANNHDSFNTYSIDWTASQIVWSINGQTVRVLTAADAGNQYPQTPMMIKVGIWAGGDPANAPGTIQWAGGQTDYTQGPFTMYLKSIHVSDYSTGSSYSYSGTAGTWQSIVSNGGQINSSGKNVPAVSSSPTVSTASGAPIPFSTDASASSVYATRTGYPWVVATASLVTTSTAVYTTPHGLPSGWTVSNSGKVVPPSAGSIESLSVSYWSASWLASSSASDVEQTTTLNAQTFSTLTTLTTTSVYVTSTSPTSLTVETSSTSGSYPSQSMLISSSSSSNFVSAVTTATSTSTTGVTLTSNVPSDQSTSSIGSSSSSSSTGSTSKVLPSSSMSTSTRTQSSTGRTTTTRSSTTRPTSSSDASSTTQIPPAPSANTAANRFPIYFWVALAGLSTILAL